MNEFDEELSHSPRFSDNPSFETDEPGRWSTIAHATQSIYYFVAGFLGLTLLILILVKGLVWYWDNAYPAISYVAGFPVILLLPTGLILGIFKRSRGLGGVFLVICSLLYISAIWTQSLALSYAYLGKVWMLVGFFLFGLGVFFMAIIGSLLHGAYTDSVSIIIGLTIAVLVHLAGHWMAVSGDRHSIAQVK